MWSDFQNSTCRQNYSYFATSNFLVTAYGVMSLINIPLSILAFFIIHKRTPLAMWKMRPALLFAQFCSTNLDICATLLVCPMAFFPSASATTLGILTKLGVPFRWQAYWGQVGIMLNGVAFVILYENRQSQVTTITFKIKKQIHRVLYYLALTICAFLSILPFYLEETNQLELRQFVLARIPCPSIEFYDPATYVLLKGGESAPFFSLTLMMAYIVFQSLFFAIQVIIHTVITRNVNLSTATKQLQRRFLGYTTLQIIIPMAALIVPTVYSLYADEMNYYNQSYNNFAILAFGSHGLLATAVTLIVYKPYRETILSFFKKDNKIAMRPANIDLSSGTAH